VLLSHQKAHLVAEDGAVQIRRQHQLVALRQKVAQRAERWLVVPVHESGNISRRQRVERAMRSPAWQVCWRQWLAVQGG
jgi:hypothetical protein